ncbi:MAG: 50S ribosomal protein L9 [Syntrophomonas sp.]|nr:50S ribosomal protein L9 [Syntrophomonas sp.]
MKVILTEDIKKLGVMGQIVEVTNGYGRNYLIPHGLAEEATKGKVSEIEAKSLKAEKRKHSEKERAEALKQQLHGQKVEIKVKAGSGDKLFGAVTAKEIAESLQAAFGVTIDKKKIDTGDPIKHLGTHNIKLKIYPAVQADIKLVVVPE